MTATQPHYSTLVTRGTVYSPQHVGGVARALSGLLGLSPKHAERRLHEAQKIVDRIVEAARRAGKPEFAAKFFAHADAQRKIDGSPMPVDAPMLCHLMRDIAAEGISITDILASKTDDERAHLLKMSKRLAVDLAEVIAGLEA